MGGYLLCFVFSKNKECVVFKKILVECFIDNWHIVTVKQLTFARHFALIKQLTYAFKIVFSTPSMCATLLCMFLRCIVWPSFGKTKNEGLILFTRTYTCAKNKTEDISAVSVNTHTQSLVYSTVLRFCNQCLTWKREKTPTRKHWQPQKFCFVTVRAFCYIHYMYPTRN